jgi:hypothetical protein
LKGYWLEWDNAGKPEMTWTEKSIKSRGKDIAKVIESFIKADNEYPVPRSTPQKKDETRTASQMADNGQKPKRQRRSKVQSTSELPG